jgi:hypothetical protein
MPRTSLVALLLLALLAGPLRADEADVALARWLAAAPPDPPRWAPEVIERRRSHPDLLGRLVRLAFDPTAPRAARERALDLLGSLGDEAALADVFRAQLHDPALGPAATWGLVRLELRGRVDRLLERVLSARGEARQRALDEAARQAVGSAAAELTALARDPLLAPATRAAAIAVLGEATADDGIDLVLEALAGEAEGPLLEAALEALARRKNPQALPAGLASLLRRRALGPVERALVVRFVGRLDPREGLNALWRRALGGGAATEVAARALAVRALGLARHAGAAPRLRTLLADEGVPRSLQVALVTALLRLEGYDPARDDRAAALLAGAALGVGPEVEDAVEGLALLPPRLVEAALGGLLGRDDPERRARGFDVVLALRLEGLAGAASEAALDDDAPWTVRLAAVQALAGLDERSVPPLARLLASAGREAGGAAGSPAGPDAVVLRRAAADALGALPPTPATVDAGRAALEAALDDEAPTVRRAALRALGAWADPRSRAAVAAVLARPARTTDERLARTDAAARLGLVEAEPAALVLAARLEDQDPALALALVDYARGAKDAFAAGPLVDLLGHRAPEVREAAFLDLRRRSGQGFGFDPAAEPETQAAALREWRTFAERLRR